MNETVPIIGIPDVDDGLFFTAVNHPQKVSTLTWRGTNRMQGLLANAGSSLLGMDHQLASHFSDRDTSNPLCSSQEPNMKFFGGQSMNPDIMQRVLDVLTGLRRRYPDYSVVINGQSLGGVKTMLTAAYLAKFHLQDIPVAAVYTYGMPPPGNTEFNNWLAVCVGPEKVVRVVSSNDIVPFARGSYQVMQASNVIEVYNPDATRNEWRRCQRGLNCRERSWENHMRYGGVYFGSAMCRPSTPSSK